MVARGWFASCVVLGACGRISFDPLSNPVGVDGPGASGSFSTLCAIPMFTVITAPGSPEEQNLAAMLPGRIAAGCGTNPTVSTVSQDDPGVLEVGTNRPLLATGQLGITVGGQVVHRTIDYLERADTPLIFEIIVANVRVTARANNQVLLDVPETTFDNTHDVALVMLTHEPILGASYLSAYGRGNTGSIAAPLWFITTIAPTIRTELRQWYLLDWRNADADPLPSADDTITVTASSP